MEAFKKVLIIKFVLILIMASNCYAQKVKTTKGEATIKVEANQSRIQARSRALQLAMINGIENVFGTYIEQEAGLTIKDGISSFSLIGTTKVKGEWIESINEMYSESSQTIKEQGESRIEIYITCEVTGKVREIQPKAGLEFEILNCPQIECRTRTFLNLEQLYVYFKSPVNGYLSIFVDEGTITRRILPYSNMPKNYQNSAEIKADQEYLLFSPINNVFKNSSVDEMILFTNHNEEQITIILVFSEKQFIKPILSEVTETDDFTLPKSMSSSKFTKWLAENRAIENSFQDLKINIEIKKKE